MFTGRDLRFASHAPVAQLDRVPDYESGGRMFESCRVHHLYLAGYGRRTGRPVSFFMSALLRLAAEFLGNEFAG